MTRAHLESLNAPSQRHLDEIRAFAAAHDLEILEESDARHDVVLEGTTGDLEEAFHVELHEYDHPEEGRYHSHDGNVRIPAALDDVVVAVLGLDGTPVRRFVSLGSGCFDPIAAPALADHYKFPSELDGTGERIAIVALGGGYYEEDLDRYFESLGIEKPDIRAVSVDGAENRPLEREKLCEIVAEYNDLNNSMGQLWQDYGPAFAETIVTAETSMDVQVAGSIANGAHIDVYFAPANASGLYHAIYAAAGIGHDVKHDDGSPHETTPATVLSLSWGWPESQIPASAVTTTENALQQAQSLGVCLCCASGDSGSLGEESLSTASVLYPASSPSVLACGGTQFNGRFGPRTHEVVWNSDNRGVPQATGGGVSGAFPLPDWQRGANIPARWQLNGEAWINPAIPEGERARFRGRGVPDVSGYADQIPGYAFVLAGLQTSAGGTSAATPLWAGLVARMCEGLGRRLPWLHELVYDPFVSVSFRSVEGQSNRIGDGPAAYFEATPGWNGCCGLGVPDATELIRRLRRLESRVGR